MGSSHPSDHLSIHMLQNLPVLHICLDQIPHSLPLFLAWTGHQRLFSPWLESISLLCFLELISQSSLLFYIVIHTNSYCLGVQTKHVLPLEITCFV